MLYTNVLQIAMKNGVLQNWGLVEFKSAEEAEETLQKLNGHKLTEDSQTGIRVQFCIPGLHAINIYMDYINNPMDNVETKKALMEETPSDKVYDQLQSLASQNPWFVHSLQNIMATTNMKIKANLRTPGPPPPPTTSTSTADPAQAALVLLLAGKAISAPGCPDLMKTVVGQMRSGVSAADILR